MWSIIEQIFPYAISYTIPLLITALGALYCERSGVVNIGLDGLMIIGSFAGALTVSKLQVNGVPGALWIGLLVAVLIGVLFSLLHAFASINLNADQVISGTAINMMAGALTIYLARNITGSGNIRVANGFIPRDIPVLSDIPVIGPLFFTKTYVTTWVVLIILALSIFILYKTSFGLRLRACGEHPQAAASVGIKVKKIRYIAVLTSGFFHVIMYPVGYPLYNEYIGEIATWDIAEKALAEACEKAGIRMHRLHHCRSLRCSVYHAVDR